MALLRGSTPGTLAALLALAAVTSCGGGSGGPGAPSPGGATGTLAATVDGASFVAELGAQAIVSAAHPGIYTLTGSRLVAVATAQTISITLYNLDSTGTYALGMGPTVVGGTASYTEGSTTWLTPLSGAAGTITITALTAHAIAGTFSFTADPMVGGGASRVVTSGTFTVPITGTPGTLAPNAGSSMSATLGGTAFRAATVVTVADTGGVYSFGGSNTASFVNFTLSSVGGPGAIGLDATTEKLTITSGSQSWSSTPGSGTVTLTEVSASRLKGTVTATLQGSSGTLAVTDGVFDIGLP